MSWFGCRHKQLSDVTPSGFQHCLECHRAFKPVATKSCHVLKDLMTEGVLLRIPGEWGAHRHDVVQQRCKKCGKRFTYNSTLGEYKNENPSNSKCET